MTRTRRPSLFLATAALLGLAVVFGVLALLTPGGGPHSVNIVAASAGLLWLLAASLTGLPVVRYLMERRRFRVALSGE